MSGNLPPFLHPCFRCRCPSKGPLWPELWLVLSAEPSLPHTLASPKSVSHEARHLKGTCGPATPSREAFLLLSGKDPRSSLGLGVLPARTGAVQRCFTRISPGFITLPALHMCPAPACLGAPSLLLRPRWPGEFLVVSGPPYGAPAGLLEACLRPTRVGLGRAAGQRAEYLVCRRVDAAAVLRGLVVGGGVALEAALS